MEITKHIAISLDNISDWSRKNNIPFDSGCEKYFRNLGSLLGLQLKSNMPMITVHLFFDNAEKYPEEYILFCDFMADFFSQLLENPQVSEQQMKVTILGKWYNLPGRLVESLKNVIEATKDYSNYFVNFCINYDGQEEILDACKLIAKQVELGKINAEMVTRENIKENLYSSYFLPPDIFLIYGEKKIPGLLLWDSVNSRIEFAEKSWMEFEEGDLVKFIGKLNRNLYK